MTPNKPNLAERLEQHQIGSALAGATKTTASLILADLLGLLPEKQGSGYDGNSLESASKSHGIAFKTWGEVVRYEQAYNQAIDELRQAITQYAGGVE